MKRSPWHQVAALGLFFGLLAYGTSLGVMVAYDQRLDRLTAPKLGVYPPPAISRDWLDKGTSDD